MRQKFFRGQLVWVWKSPETWGMDHFTFNRKAIVIGSYSDQYGGKNTSDFTLLLFKQNGNPQDKCSWYHDHQMKLLSDNRKNGEKIIQSYK